MLGSILTYRETFQEIKAKNTYLIRRKHSLFNNHFQRHSLGLVLQLLCSLYIDRFCLTRHQILIITEWPTTKICDRSSPPTCSKCDKRNEFLTGFKRLLNSPFWIQKIKKNSKIQKNILLSANKLVCPVRWTMPPVTPFKPLLLPDLIVQWPVLGFCLCCLCLMFGFHLSWYYLSPEW